MTGPGLVAGVDIGNATTEVVVADVRQDPPVPLAWDRRPTRGTKGTAEATEGAARLLARIERRLGSGVATVVLTPQAPVTSRTVVLRRPPVDTWPLRVLLHESPTPAGEGAGAGRPVPVEAEPCAGPVVLVASDPLGYRRTSDAVRRWLAAGADLRAVLLAGDEARLVRARVPGLRAPIVDGVDTAPVLEHPVVGVEVAAPGAPLRHLVDPVWLVDALGLARGAHPAARAVAAELAGSRAGVVGLLDGSRPEPVADADLARVWLDGEAQDLLDVLDVLRAAPAGAVSRLRLGETDDEEVSDLGLVDLDGGGLPMLRPAALARHQVGLATLPPPDRGRAWPGVLGPDRRVHLAPSEAQAALAGALSTPGAGREVTVVDLGGGTLDLVGRAAPVTVAGCGELLTRAVAAVLHVSAGTAEWVKRAPSLRVEGPHTATDESGARHFLDGVALPGTVGWLTVPGPGGRLPFSADLVPAEWRLVRQALKRLVVATSLARAVVSRSEPLTGVVLLAGGPAADDELLDLLRVEHPAAVVGRASVAGILGPRFAVAHGLVLQHAAGLTTPAWPA